MFGSSVCNTLILTTMKSEFRGEKNYENIIGYRIFFRYLDYIWNFEEHDWLAALLGRMSLLADGSPADFAYESNWNNAVEKISDPNDTY